MIFIVKSKEEQREFYKRNKGSEEGGKEERKGPLPMIFGINHTHKFHT